MPAGFFSDVGLLSFNKLQPLVGRLFFFFSLIKKMDLCVVVIIPRPMVQLGKLMGTTSLNWSSETPNSHALQALLVFGTFRNCNYSSHENSNLGCGEISAITYQLYHTCWWSILELHVVKSHDRQKVVYKLWGIKSKDKIEEI